MTNIQQGVKIFDLRERILAFVLAVINLANKLPENRINRIFIDQIIRSASGMGSNYEEADGSPTKKEFAYKMSIVKKEGKETKYWLILIKTTNDTKFTQEINGLLQENEELIKIISKIIIKSSS